MCDMYNYNTDRYVTLSPKRPRKREEVERKKRAYTTISHSLDRTRREIHVVDTEADRDLLLCLAAAR